LNVFREPTIELPQPFYLSSGRIMLSTEEPVDLLVPDAEALLEVLLDICPNAKALANNWLLDEQKREYMEGGKP
jgi:hypothetical protein